MVWTTSRNSKKSAWDFSTSVTITFPGKTQSAALYLFMGHSIRWMKCPRYPSCCKLCLSQFWTSLFLVHARHLAWTRKREVQSQPCSITQMYSARVLRHWLNIICQVRFRIGWLLCQIGMDGHPPLHPAGIQTAPQNLIFLHNFIFTPILRESYYFTGILQLMDFLMTKWFNLQKIRSHMPCPYQSITSRDSLRLSFR